MHLLHKLKLGGQTFKLFFGYESLIKSRNLRFVNVERRIFYEDARRICQRVWNKLQRKQCVRIRVPFCANAIIFGRFKTKALIIFGVAKNQNRCIAHLCGNLFCPLNERGSNALMLVSGQNRQRSKAEHFLS